MVVVATLASGRTCGAEVPIRRFDIASKATGARYVIEVVVPSGAPANGTNYPAVYCTDWFVLSDYLKALPGLMEMGRLAEPFVFVGISQEGGSAE